MAEPIVLVHGWAQSPRAWRLVLPHLPNDAIALALPGHGGAPMRPLEQWPKALLAEMPRTRCVGVGWSLGGLVLLQAAQLAPERFSRLVLLCAGARFLVDRDWPGAQKQALAAMRAAIDEGAKALQRFFLLALHGEPKQRIRFLSREVLDRRRPPSKQALRAGLEALQNWDLRPALAQLAVPSLWLAAGRDRIWPAEGVRASAALAADARFVFWQHAGHAPLWTHPVDTARLIAEG